MYENERHVGPMRLTIGDLPFSHLCREVQLPEIKFQTQEITTFSHSFKETLTSDLGENMEITFTVYGSGISLTPSNKILNFTLGLLREEGNFKLIYSGQGRISGMSTTPLIPGETLQQTITMNLVYFKMLISKTNSWRSWGIQSRDISSGKLKEYNEELLG